METDQLIQSELVDFREAVQQQWSEGPLSICVRRALDCIHEHLFDEQLSVAFVRRRCELHDNNVSSLFKHEVGIGMRRYIEEKRLEAAKRLLCHSEVPIAEIAWAIGHKYPQTFTRSFKRREGCPPSQYREKNC